jgi:hypothetical protein
MKFKITLMLFGLVVLGITSCKKEFDLDINDDPNNPNLEQLTPKLVFPAAVVSSASRIGGDLSIVGSIWAQYYTQGTTAGQYKNRSQ